jgi:hypothetical protein
VGPRRELTNNRNYELTSSTLQKCRKLLLLLLAKMWRISQPVMLGKPTKLIAEI